jgi:hypothetical protein
VGILTGYAAAITGNPTNIKNPADIINRVHSNKKTKLTMKTGTA